MVPRIILVLALAYGAAAAQAGIDFTPVPQETSFEGVRVKQTGFRNGSDLVLYNPPGDWIMRGEGSRLRLEPATGSMVEALIESHPLDGKSAPDIETMEQVRREMSASLPKEAEKVEWGEMELNPLLLNRHQTRRLTVTYSAYAQRFTATILVCNFEAEQIRFRLSARAIDFDRVYDAFRRSLYSWQGMK